MGAYERDNFGDLLFLLVTERYLGGADVVAAAPFAADMRRLLGRRIPAFGPLHSHPLASVIVPVFDPGEAIDECIASLLGQTMPAGRARADLRRRRLDRRHRERLDALAAAHDHVRVTHIPNSGWPGRPRNVGIDMARGEYVYFVDNDD